MPAFVDLRGQRFGRLTVLLACDSRRSGSVEWLCRCTCGREFVRCTGDINQSIKRGNEPSCGQCKKHDWVGTPTYHSWSGMVSRCTNPNGPNWEQYGGRGIKVCERWKVFINFLEDMGPCPPGLTIERIDNDGDYVPGNCCWATRKAQSRNRRGNRVFTIDGVTKTLNEWAVTYGVDRRLIAQRLKDGWRPEMRHHDPAAWYRKQTVSVYEGIVL